MLSKSNERNVNDVDEIIDQVVQNSTILVEIALSQSRRSKRSKTTKQYDLSDDDEGSALKVSEDILSNEFDVGFTYPMCDAIIEHVKNKKRHISDLCGTRLSYGTFCRRRICCLKYGTTQTSKIENHGNQIYLFNCIFFE